MLYDPPTPLQPAQHDSVRRLFRRSAHRHEHIDWRDFAGWLSHPDLCCWVVHRAGEIVALLGATLRHPPDPTQPRAAWLRFILPRSLAEPDPALIDLWGALSEDLRQQRVGQVALLELDQWVGALAEALGFSRVTSVITMERSRGALPPPPAPPLRIRQVADQTDVEKAAAIDAIAFAPIWQYSLDTLLAARQEAATFTLLEQHERVLGYQLSTRHTNNAHLARLAVHPDAQGRGYGGLLIGDMIRFFEKRGLRTITVNTQEDNIRSQRLYERLGFTRTQFDVPVWMIDL